MSASAPVSASNATPHKLVTTVTAQPQALS